MFSCFPKSFPNYFFDCPCIQDAAANSWDPSVDIETMTEPKSLHNTEHQFGTQNLIFLILQCNGPPTTPAPLRRQGRQSQICKHSVNQVGKSKSSMVGIPLAKRNTFMQKRCCRENVYAVSALLRPFDN